MHDSKRILLIWTDSESFVRSFRRFIARRVWCVNNIISDNDKNFVCEETQIFASNLKVYLFKFKFKSIGVIGMTVFFERLVRSVKKIASEMQTKLRRNANCAFWNRVKRWTRLTRPLAYVYPTDQESCLTPN